MSPRVHSVDDLCMGAIGSRHGERNGMKCKVWSVID